MGSDDKSSGDTKVSKSRENYNALISLIEETLDKIYRNRGQLVDGSHEGMYLNIQMLMHKDELEQSVSKNEWVLQQISERNFHRHKELVNLLRERAELRHLIIKPPAGAGGIRKNEKIEQKITNIENRIEAIISGAEQQ